MANAMNMGTMLAEFTVIMIVVMLTRNRSGGQSRSDRKTQ